MKFTIGRKLTTLVGTAIVVLLIVGGLALNENTKVKAAWDTYQTEVAERAQILSEIKSLFGYGGAIHNFKNFVLRFTEKHEGRAKKQLTNVMSATETYRAIPGITSVESAALDTVKDTAQTYLDAVGTARALIEGGSDVRGVDSVIKINDGPALAAFKTLEEEYDRLTAMKTEEINTSVRDFRVFLIVAIVISVVILSFFGTLIGRTILVPVRALTEATAKIADGDLTQQVTVDTTDEIGEMAKLFNTMSENLRNMFKELKKSSESLATASEELSGTTEQLASGSISQSKTAGDVATAMEEMAGSVQGTYTNAQNSLDISQKTAEAAEKGGDIVERTISGMARIELAVNDSASKVQALGERSGEIVKIVEIIKEIASQTNLLALNAAIEASRAGEHGRGFEVVAEEIRKLAEKSVGSTVQITEIVDEISTETKLTVDSMGGVTKEVEDGKDLSNQTGSALREIIDHVKETLESIKLVTDATKQQAAVSDQVATSVENISTITKETATGSEEIARTAQDLARLGDNLKRVVDRFKI